MTDHVYVQPKVDVHYVHNFFQFGTNWVPQYGVNVGYRFGESRIRARAIRACA